MLALLCQTGYNFKILGITEVVRCWVKLSNGVASDFPGNVAAIRQAAATSWDARRTRQCPAGAI